MYSNSFYELMFDGCQVPHFSNVRLICKNFDFSILSKTDDGLVNCFFWMIHVIPVLFFEALGGIYWKMGVYKFSMKRHVCGRYEHWAPFSALFVTVQNFFYSSHWFVIQSHIDFNSHTMITTTRWWLFDIIEQFFC